MPRIYLDNAATSWPKPEPVYLAVDRYLRQSGAPAGRSAYATASEVERSVAATRSSVAQWIGLDDPAHLIFTSNGTDSLNMAIHGLLRPGDHVVTTVVEHNSVLRPLHACREHIGIDVTYVGCNDEGVIDPDDMQRALRPETRLVVVLHASNVTGAIQPVAEVAGRMQGHAALLLLDAAQSLGHLPTAMADLGCDLLAAPGHKGLLGPLGTGILALGPRAVDRVASTRQGGTGTRSETDEQPDSLPDRLESGNHNVPGILGLGAGVAYLRERGLDALRRHEVELTQKLVEGLAETSGVTVYGPRQSDRRVGVVSVSIEGYDSQEAAALLDAAYGIEVRAGLHCAPRLHRALGTLERGGALRLSLSCFNTAEDVAAAIAAIREITTHSLAG